MRMFSCRQSLGRLGAEMKLTGPLFGSGTNPFNIAAAFGSIDTLLPGNGWPVDGSIGRRQPDATTGLNVGDPGRHSLKSPCLIARLGTPADRTVPSRNRVQLCD